MRNQYLFLVFFLLCSCGSKDKPIVIETDSEYPPQSCLNDTAKDIVMKEVDSLFKEKVAHFDKPEIHSCYGKDNIYYFLSLYRTEISFLFKRHFQYTGHCVKVILDSSNTVASSEVIFNLYCITNINDAKVAFDKLVKEGDLDKEWIKEQFCIYPPTSRY